MADASGNSACKRVQEDKKPPRTCTLCRREDCPVWQDILEKRDSPTDRGEPLAVVGRTPDGPVEVGEQDLMKDIGEESSEEKRKSQLKVHRPADV